LGCNIKVAPEHQQIHEEKECLLKLIPCIALNVSCTWTGLRSELFNHTTHCAYVKLHTLLITLIQENQQLKQQLQGQETKIQTMEQQLKVVQPSEVNNTQTKFFIDRLIHRIVGKEDQIISCALINNEYIHKYKRKEEQPFGNNQSRNCYEQVIKLRFSNIDNIKTTVKPNNLPKVIKETNRNNQNFTFTLCHAVNAALNLNVPIALQLIDFEFSFDGTIYFSRSGFILEIEIPNSKRIDFEINSNSLKMIFISFVKL